MKSDEGILFILLSFHAALEVNQLPPEIILWSGLISGLTFAWLKWWGGLRIDEATEDMGMDAKSHSPPKAEECAMGKKLGEDVEMLGD